MRYDQLQVPIKRFRHVAQNLEVGITIAYNGKDFIVAFSSPRLWQNARTGCVIYGLVRRPHMTITFYI